MSDVLTKQTCAAHAKYDMVGLKFGSYQLLLYYQIGFEISAGILMAAKHAARYEGVHPRKWSEAVNNTRLQAIVQPLHRGYRRSGHTPNFKDWSIAFDRNLVMLTFDETTIKLHYGDAFEMYGMIWLACKNAKAWAGDSSKQRTFRACLTDAEDNDKFIYV